MVDGGVGVGGVVGGGVVVVVGAGVAVGIGVVVKGFSENRNISLTVMILEKMCFLYAG